MLTYQYRIKDKNKIKLLDQMKRDTNFVWNVLNSASRKVWNESRKYFHKYDPYFTNIIKGASSYLTLHSQTLQAIVEQFHKDLHQQRKQLRFRGRKSLGWIPFKAAAIKIEDGTFIYKKTKFRFWKSRDLPEDFKLKTGCFSQDVLGHWFVSFTFDAENTSQCGEGAVGIDLGLKTTATCSNADELSLKPLAGIDKKIGKQQRARNFRRAKKLSLHKANKRKDMIRKFTKNLVTANGLVVVGNVSGFTKGKMAKSRYNNSWSALKTWIELKCKEYGALYLEQFGSRNPVSLEAG